MVNATMATKARTYTRNTGHTLGAMTASREAPSSAYGIHAEHPRDRLAQAVFLDLARRCHGELADDLESLREFVASQLPGVEVGDELGERDDLTRLRDHEGAGALDQTRIGHRDDGHVLDLRMSVEQVFNLGHRDVLATPNDQVLDATRDRQVTVDVEHRAVSGPEPAVERVRG